MKAAVIILGHGSKNSSDSDAVQRMAAEVKAVAVTDYVGAHPMMAKIVADLVQLKIGK